MSIFSKALKSMFGKATIAAAALGGFLALTPAKASAQPVYVTRPAARVVVRGGFYGPRVIVRGGFYGPRYYGPVYVHHRYWDARFHCWRYR
jgi:hypothetical protein